MTMNIPVKYMVFWVLTHQVGLFDHEDPADTRNHIWMGKAMIFGSSAFRPTSTDQTSGFWSQKLPPGNKGSFVCGEVCLPLAVHLGALGGPWTWRHLKDAMLGDFDRSSSKFQGKSGIPAIEWWWFTAFPSTRNGRLVVLQNVPGQQALQRWEGHRWWKVRLPHLGLMLLGDGVWYTPTHGRFTKKQRGGLHGCKQGTLWYTLISLGGVLKIRQSHVFFSGSEDNFKRPTNISRAFSQPTSSSGVEALRPFMWPENPMLRQRENGASSDSVCGLLICIQPEAIYF